jgi:hypothetical protein
MRTRFGLILLTGAFALGASMPVSAQPPQGDAQIVAIDDCDPTTFNAALGPNFCLNVALGALGQTVALSDLFSQAAAGTPNAGWDFAPDTVTINKDSSLSVVNEGGEPHTFTEVKQFGGGFIPGLNDGQATVPECANGFSNPQVALTRVLQGSQRQINGLSKGTHLFECCIHPWMRTQVIVK